MPFINRLYFCHIAINECLYAIVYLLVFVQDKFGTMVTTRRH